MSLALIALGAHRCIPTNIAMPFLW
jgi:hypothetical protein